jgi:hypothetical protein
MIIDWKRLDLVLIGRLAGLLVIAGGIAVSAWTALDTEGFETDASFTWRYFLQSSLTFIASGGLLILAAEIADRLTWSWDEEELEEAGTVAEEGEAS